MNKHVSIGLIVLATLLVASCTPATQVPVATPTTQVAAPTAAPTQAKATPAPPPTTGAVVTPDSRPIVPAPPADGSRPLSKLSAAERTDRFSGPAATYTKAGTIYLATIVTTKGNIVAELYPDAVQSVNNFVTLAKGGFYDGLTFHRVEPGFVIQGGDPKGDGSGGPGYTIPAEIQHTHPRGALAWARTGDQANPQRRSSGSQFYVTLADTPFLDGAYTSFGLVIQGMDVVDKIAVGDTITRIDISEATSSKLPTPTPTPLPKAPKSEPGRPLAKLPVEQRDGLYNSPPAMTIDKNRTYQATIESAKGKIVADLDAKSAPIAVNSFVLLANLGFYDGMPVAFVQPGAVVLFGSPASQPDSHVGYLLEPEVTLQGDSIITGTLLLYPLPNQTNDALMASGSEVFITLSTLPNDGTPLGILGAVKSGLEVANKLVVGDVITSITITEK